MASVDFRYVPRLSRSAFEIAASCPASSFARFASSLIALRSAGKYRIDGFALAHVLALEREGLCLGRQLQNVLEHSRSPRLSHRANQLLWV